MSSSKLGSRVAAKLQGGASDKGKSASAPKAPTPASGTGANGSSSAPPSSPPPQQQPTEASEEDQVSPLPNMANLKVDAAAAQNSGAARLQRQYSVRSQVTVDTLEQLELEVLEMQTLQAEAENTLSSTPGDQLDPALRNSLAQLHGNANKLLATRIDAILTSELVSGRDDARAKRKALIKVVEELIEKVEGLVKQFDKARAPFTPAK